MVCLYFIMGKLIFYMDDESREQLKAMYVALGGDPDEWDRKIARMNKGRVDSHEDYAYEMRQPPSYGKRRPG